MPESSTTLGQPLPLPIISVGATLIESDEGPSALPAVVVDATGRADVADLARVHETEGIGNVRTLAIRAGDTGERVDLSVVLTSPVSCAFTIQFDAADPDGFLSSVCAAGTLVIATTQPEAGELCLAVDIDGASLANVLSSSPESGSQ